MTQKICVFIFVLFCPIVASAQTNVISTNSTWIDAKEKLIDRACGAVKLLPLLSASPVCKARRSARPFMEARGNLAVRKKSNHKAKTLIRESARLFTKSTSMDVRTQAVSMRFRPAIKTQNRVGITVKGRF